MTLKVVSYPASKSEASRSAKGKQLTKNERQIASRFLVNNQMRI